MLLSIRALSVALATSSWWSLDLGESREKYNKHKLLSHRCFLILIWKLLCLKKRICVAPCMVTSWIENIKCLHVLWCGKGNDKVSIQTFKTQFSHHSINFVKRLDCASASFLYWRHKNEQIKNSALKTIESNDRILNLESTKQDRRKSASLFNL